MVRKHEEYKTLSLHHLIQTVHLIQHVTPSQGDKVLDIDFKDYKFSASDLPEFTSFQIKVVFNGTNSAYPARLKDFRAFALAV